MNMNQQNLIKKLIQESVLEVESVETVTYDPELNDGVVMEPTYLLHLESMDNGNIFGITIQLTKELYTQFQSEE